MVYQSATIFTPQTEIAPSSDFRPDVMVLPYSYDALLELCGYILGVYESLFVEDNVVYTIQQEVLIGQCLEHGYGFDTISYSQYFNTHEQSLASVRSLFVMYLPKPTRRTQLQHERWYNRSALYFITETAKGITYL